MSDNNDIKTFWDILNSNITIKIPKIQRDYAQGREENLDKLEDFLDYLKKYLVEDKGRAILDFIYGAEKEETNPDTEEKTITMLPLDGQQRLTTLFLLHVYAMKRCPDKNTDDSKETLKRFTYDTRNTAAKFCRALIENDFEIRSPEEKDEEGKTIEKILSKDIKEQTWYFSSFDDDQTVKAMINSLDMINEKFYEKSDLLWKKLTLERNIAFHYLNLKEYELTDDLYIKMNARGKSLTNFENLKAELTEWLKKAKNNPENQGNEEFLHNAKIFNRKIDNEWSNLLWKLKGGADNKNYLVDTAFMRIFANCIIFNSSNKDAIRNLNENEQQKNMIKFFLYPNYSLEAKTSEEETDNEYSINIFNDFCRILELYYEKQGEFENFIEFPLWGTKTQKTFIKDFIIGKQGAAQSNLQDKLLFYAHTLYLDKVENNNNENYLKWIRIIRNIAYSRVIDKTSTATIAFSYKNKEAKDILKVFPVIKYLLSELLKKDSFTEALKDLDNEEKIKELKEETNEPTFEIIQEEIQKAKLICSDNDYKKIFEQLEDNELLHGSVKYALTCLKTDLKEQIDKSELQKLADFFDKYFFDEDTYEKHESETKDLFKRALFVRIEDDKWKYIRNARYQNYYRYQFFGNIPNIFYITTIDATRTQNKNIPYIKEKLTELIKDCYTGNTTFQNIVDNYVEEPDKEWKNEIIKNKNNILNREKINEIFISEDKNNEGSYQLYIPEKDT